MAYQVIALSTSTTLVRALEAIAQPYPLPELHHLQPGNSHFILPST
jgi:hypothetical protein